MPAHPQQPAPATPPVLPILQTLPVFWLQQTALQAIPFNLPTIQQAAAPPIWRIKIKLQPN